MSVEILDGKRFAEMIFQAAAHLSANAKYVDSLNVFPVPDGDTGTNMNLSLTSGAKEVRKNVQDHIGKVGAALAKGLLMGARGNSGVILSQIFRGFAKSIEDKPVLDGKAFAAAVEAGVQTAYKAVMKPVEGTILTVAKDSAKKAVESAKKHSDIVKIMEDIVAEAKASLQRTPDLLPVLKEVGVVNSGGQGLVIGYEGFLAQLKGKKISGVEAAVPSMEELVKAEHHRSVQSQLATEDIEFGYCTEFMVRFEQDKIAQHPFTEQKFREDLSKYGDSLLVVADDDVVKVHIHSEQPGEVLTYGQRYGSLFNIKIENMRQQHTAIVEKDRVAAVKVPQKQQQLEFGIITVAMGSGIAEMFRSIGAHEVIEGGQTMNPSTEDFVKAIEKLNAKNIIILPNNKNIIMAAEQAAEIVEENVAVVPSKTVPQGMSALLAFNPTADLETNKEEMTEALRHVKTGQITFAVRDTNYNGLNIKKDDFMGIYDGQIVVKAEGDLDSAKKLVKEMMDDDSEILTIFKGEDASDEDVEALVEYVESEFPDVEIEVHDGKQPLYAFIFSVE